MVFKAMGMWHKKEPVPSYRNINIWKWLDPSQERQQSRKDYRRTKKPRFSKDARMRMEPCGARSALPELTNTEQH